MRLIQALMFCSTIFAAGYLIIEATLGSDYYGFERRFKRGLVVFAALSIASAILIILTPALGTPAKREPVSNQSNNLAYGDTGGENARTTEVK